jgi:hypothetical protein
MSDEHSAADRLSWHDNLIYGLQLWGADPDRNIWRSDLVLDIDHIVEWVRGADGRVKFRIAPATLVFHDVRDLKVDVDFGGGGYPQNLNELSIAKIDKEPAATEAKTAGRAFYRWGFELNLPQGGEIVFGASGYTQTLRAPARLVDEQRLHADDRPPLDGQSS